MNDDTSKQDRRVPGIEPGEQLSGLTGKAATGTLTRFGYSTDDAARLILLAELAGRTGVILRKFRGDAAPYVLSYDGGGFALTPQDPASWPANDPELVAALVKWAMSRGAIITRDWFGLPPLPDGEIQDGLTRGQATVALRRLGYDSPGEASVVVTRAEEYGQHLATRHLVSFHGGEAGFAIAPRAEAPPAGKADVSDLFPLGLEGLSGEQADLLVQLRAGIPVRRPDVHDHEEHRDGTVTGCPACDRVLNEPIPVRLSSPEVPDDAPLLQVRQAFYEALERASAAPRTAAEHEAAWLREIASITADRRLADAEAGLRVRAALWPPHCHDDDGTVEGCPGCFPPGEVVGRHLPDVRNVTAGGVLTPVPPSGADLDWLWAVIPVVDRWLDDAAPPLFRQDPDDPDELNEARAVLNMYRRFAAGPVSEAAEAVDALNGMTGGNPRKGVTHSRADLLGEAADTAFSALLAIQSQTKDIAATWCIFTEAAAKAYSRVPDANRPGASGEEIARGCADC